MRLQGWVELHSLPQVETRIQPISSLDARAVAARLHDSTAGLALGIGYLRDGGLGQRGQRSREEAVPLLEQALGQLKLLEQELSRKESSDGVADLLSELQLQAQILGLELDLQVTGSPKSLAPSQLELLRLAGREAMVNVRKHTAGRACRIELDLASCPFSLRARDWGTAFAGSSAGGHGLDLLAELARWLGCKVTLTSQPGLGTELVVLGPGCRHGNGLMPSPAKEVASS